MLHRVETGRLRVGMFVAAMECSWLASPFWRRRFLIESEADIRSLHDADVAWVTIDDARGLSPAPDITIDDRAVEETPTPTAAPVVSPIRSRRRIAVVSEIERARETVERSRVQVTRMFHEARLGQAVQVGSIQPLVDDIAASVTRDPGAMIEVTRLKNKNEYTYLHSVAVCALMINLARRLHLPEQDARRIGMAGLLHDIGKMAVPAAILDKPGALDDTEFARIRSHPEEGHALLAGSAGIDELALDVCLHHHERIDGRGYPFGKKAEEISIYARMGAICDVYDAVTSNRPYKQAWSPNEALARMREWEGHFDPDILEAFIESIGIPPLDGLVRLTSNRLGLVVAGNDADPTCPRVRAFYSIPDQSFEALADVGTGSAADDDAILQMERGAYWFGDSWRAIRDRIRDGLLPDPTDFEPARPYISIGERGSAAMHATLEAMRRNRRAATG